MKKVLQRYNSQVSRLILLHFCVGFVFWYAIEKIFLSNQLAIGPIGIATIVMLYMAITLILDVPASVLADRWGRKRMLIFAVICFILANIVLGASQTFGMYLAGTVLWALFSVSYGGTFEAILFDSLKQEGRQRQFQKVDAWSRLFFMVGITVASVLSGLLAEQFGLRSTYFLSIVPLAIGLIALITIREPVVNHDDEVEDVLKRGYTSHLVHAFGTVWRQKKLRLVMFAMIILFFIQTPLYEFIQYVYIELFQTPLLVGLIGGIGSLFTTLGFYIAIKRKRMFNMRFALLFTGIAIAAIALIANVGSLLPLAFLFVIISIIENALQTQLQHATTSRTRASVTSAVYFAGNVLIVPFVFLFGAIAENNSIWLAYLINGVVVLIMSMAYFFVSRHYSNQDEHTRSA